MFGRLLPAARDAEARTYDFLRSGVGTAVIVQFALEQGMGVSEVLAGTGLRPDLLADPDVSVTPAQELTALRNLTVRFGERPGLGLELGRRYRVTTFGAFGYGCLTSATVGECMVFALAHRELTFGFCGTDFDLGPEEITVRYHTEALSGDIRQVILERDLAALYTVIREIIPDTPSFDLSFGFDEPADPTRFVETFGVQPVFGQAETTVRFPVAALALPLPQADADAHARCAARCRAIIDRRREPRDLVRIIRDRLAALDDHVPTIEQIAAEQNMSSRTLRRKLDAAGTTYRALLEEARRSAAQRLLRDDTLSVGQIAIGLGYAEAASFVHAYKRWTGTTPTYYRATHRAIG